MADGTACPGGACVTGSCVASTPPPSPTRYRLPIDGAEGPDWTITQYVDLDPNIGTLAIRDYTGRTMLSARTTDGHTGADFCIPDFRAMDRGVPVRAVFPGVVAYADASVVEDRNTLSSCPAGLLPNEVVIDTDDGRHVSYLHLRHASIPSGVVVGARVAAGDVLGLVGSSGCSSWPHLHLEVRDSADAVVDPIGSDLFAATPPYYSPMGVMDVALRSGSATTADCLDPVSNATAILTGDTLGICVVFGAGEPGDVMGVTLHPPPGPGEVAVTLPSSSFVSRQALRSVAWSSPLHVPGTWTVEVTINGLTAWSGPLAVW